MSLDTEILDEESTSQENELDLDLDSQDDNNEAMAEASEDVEALKAKLAKIEDTNRKLYARLKKPAEVKKPQFNSQPNEDLEWKRKVDFILTKGNGLDAETIDEVIAYSKGKGISYEQALESPLMKSYLSERNSKQRVEQATPSTSSGTRRIGKLTWSEMNDEQRRENFTKLREIQKNRKG